MNVARIVCDGAKSCAFGRTTRVRCRVRVCVVCTSGEARLKRATCLRYVGVDVCYSDFREKCVSKSRAEPVMRICGRCVCVLGVLGLLYLCEAWRDRERENVPL